MLQRLQKILFVLAISSFVANAAEVRGASAGFDSVPKGLVDLGVDGMLIFQQSTSTAASDHKAISLLGLSGQYFVLKNLAVGLTGSWLRVSMSSRIAQSETSATENGVVGLVTARYYVRTFGSLFVVPALGAGAYWARRLAPAANEILLATSIAGLAWGANLELVYYVNSTINLRAGVRLVFRTGNDTYLTDAGVGAGVGFSF